MTITRQIIFLAKRDCIEELKALLKRTIEDSKKEKGCLIYEVFLLNISGYGVVVINFLSHYPMVCVEEGRERVLS